MRVSPLGRGHAGLGLEVAQEGGFVGEAGLFGHKEEQHIHFKD